MKLIDADALKESVNAKKVVGRFNTIQLIDDAPAVDTYTEDDVQYAIKEGHQVGYEMAKAKFGRPQGEWIFDEYTRKEDKKYAPNGFYLCSVCCNKQFEKSNYCPNCGADMGKESKE